jgi:hypothetical protein
MRAIQQAAMVAVVGLAGLILAGSARGDDTYKLKLDHPYKVGDTVVVSEKVKMKVSQKVTQNGNTNETGQDYTCVLEATETVDAVTDGSKQPTKATYKITKCTKDGEVLIPEGSTVTAANVDGQSEVLVDGKAPTDEAKPVLVDLFETEDPNDSPNDEVFGTGQPLKVGGTWKVNSEKLSKELVAKKLPFDAGGLKGSGTLESISKLDGKDYEKFALQVTGTFDKKDMPDGITYTNGKLKFDLSGDVPADPAAHSMNGTIKMVMSFTQTGPNATADISIERTREFKETEPAK